MNINTVKIKNFKSLKNIEIHLNSLTLITGINSGGKSSFIEVLLLFMKANNKTIALEYPSDILFQEATNETIHLNCNNFAITLNKKENAKYIPLINTEEVNWENKNFNLFATNFQYINTNRIAPQKDYEMSKDIDNTLIGEKGEYTAHYLNINKNSPILDKFKHKKAKTRRLIENVSLWLNEISGGIEIGTKIYTDLEKVKLYYVYNYNNKKTNKYTPLNVGFGVTYVLPVIVAILKAKKGDLLIIENPESHLHPAGQSKVAELCAIASANGVQIIVETHSDHFLNGIRVATKKALLTPEQSKIYYFRKEKDELETKIDEINIDKDGGIDSYPKGFFDQMDEDLDKLITW